MCDTMLSYLPHTEQDHKEMCDTMLSYLPHTEGRAQTVL